MDNVKRQCVIDIETNGFIENLVDYSSFPYKLLPSAKLWCVVVTDVETGDEFFSELADITSEWLEKTLLPYYFIIAHNGIKFDFPMLRLFKILDYKIGYLGEKDKVFGRECKFYDSLILSRLSNPDRPAHSLKYWGNKVGEFKDDYRSQCIEAGYIDSNSDKGEEFKNYNKLMLPYCKQDCKTNIKAFKYITSEYYNHDWKTSIDIEHKLADLAFNREHLGFDFDKDLALELLDDLNNKLDNIANEVEPILPPKPLNQSELSFWTPPKTQVKKDGKLSTHMINFIKKTKSNINDKGGFTWEGKDYEIPHPYPLKTHTNPEMKDLDHIKMFLIELGWNPTEWNERDITKDSKKKILPIQKRIEVLDRWWKDTFEKGKYTEARLKELGVKEDKLYNILREKLEGKFPVRVPTTPKIKVGIEKDLCPNLIKLGEKVFFAKLFAEWLTYRHRRNSIAGGDLEDIDLEDGDSPSSGFLKSYREIDGRIPTPSIEIGAVTNRYTHINVANIPRPTSIYGKEMRSLFRAGKGAVFFGFDYASLEARIMAHYVYNYKEGLELGKQFLADKPLDWHSNQARAMGIDRGSAKSVDYGLLYGASVKKVMKMLGVTEKRAKEIYEMFWDNSPALKELRDKVTEYWDNTGKKYILGIDGRKIIVRSKHALLNSLFQSAGVIFAKYVTVLHSKKMESIGMCVSPFVGQPDICSMIEYHDEQDMYLIPKHLKFKTFDTKEDALKFTNEWQGNQLSAIGESKGKFYINLPSKISIGIEESMEEVEKFLKIKVPMGFEYMVGNSWFECH